jgi:hypothetical protein
MKIIFIVLVTVILKPAFAQLKNTRWGGAIKGDNPRNTILDFKKDTPFFTQLPTTKLWKQ